MLLNVHSHFPSVKDECVIRSLWEQYEIAGGKGLFSLGIHPRYITEEGTEQFEQLRSRAALPQVVAIGECGLDKRAEASLAIQSALFTLQIKLAAEYRKPLIIHCVRAWEEVFHLLEKERFSFPVVFHGFNKGESMATRIISKGYYLSFGKWIEKERIRTVLKKTPMDRVFLETDAVDIPIEEVYSMAATATGLALDTLSDQIKENGLRVFGEKILSV
jgi:TatD DNase family protein